MTVPGFRDARGFVEMWRAAAVSERAAVLGAPYGAIVLYEGGAS